MSEARSALQGAAFDGFARVADIGPRGMITLRGDLGDKAFQKAAGSASGTAFPGSGRIETDGDWSLAWMSPDELMMLCPFSDASGVVAKLRTALDETHHLAANVSDARAIFAISGSNVREVLAKLTPADVAPGALEPGTLRRSRLAQVPAAFWMQDETTVHIICFRSVAQYVFDLLKVAAAPGSEVEYF